MRKRSVVAPLSTPGKWTCDACEMSTTAECGHARAGQEKEARTGIVDDLLMLRGLFMRVGRRTVTSAQVPDADLFTVPD